MCAKERKNNEHTSTYLAGGAVHVTVGHVELSKEDDDLIENELRRLLPNSRGKRPIFEYKAKQDTVEE